MSNYQCGLYGWTTHRTNVYAEFSQIRAIVFAMRKGHVGTAMGGSTVLSPQRAAARNRRRKAQEAAWAAKSGAVVISHKSQTPDQIATNEKGIAAARKILEG